MSVEWVFKAKEYVAECRFHNYEFVVTADGHGGVYLQGQYEEPDTLSGKLETQYTRRWFLSPAMSKSEIVSTVFKLVMTSIEHSAREWFTFDGKAIYHPHYDVDALWEICDSGRKERNARTPNKLKTASSGSN